MVDYKNILIAIDLTQSAEDVIERALGIPNDANAKFCIVHVIDYIPYVGFGEGALITPTYTIPDEELIRTARVTINELLERMNLTNVETVIEFGTPTTEICRHAKERYTDLIVIGSHGRHGVKLLLGSTANGVLHHAPCDVLAVRIKE